MDENAKIASDAQALRRDLDSLRLQLAGFPSWMRPVVRWSLVKTRAMIVWVERQAKDSANG